MVFAAAAVERAMTYQQMIMRALAGSLSWLQAADILAIHPRSLRRWRARYEQDPKLGLLDRRRQRPSHLTAPRAEVQRILRLYREHYVGFNVRHFHQLARRDHAVTLSERPGNTGGNTDGRTLGNFEAGSGAPRNS